MKNKKRFASLLLALCMILTLMPVGYANYAGENKDFEYYYVTDDTSNLPDESPEGDIETGEGQSGILISVSDGDEFSQQVNGSIDAWNTGAEVSATGENSSASLTVDEGIYAGSVGAEISANGEGSKATLNAGEVYVEGSVGLEITAGEGGTVNVNTEDVKFKYDNDSDVFPTAVMVDADAGTANVTTGSVSSNFEGITVSVTDNGVATINSDNVDAKLDGIAIKASSGGSADITAQNVTAGNGVMAEANSTFFDFDEEPVIGPLSLGTRNIADVADGGQSTNVSLTLEDVDGEVIGLALAAGADATITADVKQVTSNGLVAVAVISEGGVVQVNAEDVNKAEEGSEELVAAAGLYVNASENGKADVLVQETIAGPMSSVVVQDGSDQDAISITAWKIELNEGGNAVETLKDDVRNMMNEEGEPPETEHDDLAQAVEKKINYIIKVEQPNTGATLKATKKDGSALEKSHDYDVAHEDEEVYLKVELSAGYQLAGAFSDDGKSVPMSVDANGNYYVKVPKGGGVYLSVKVAKKTANYVEYLPEEAPVQVKVKKVKKAAAEKPAVAMKVVSVSETKTEYELTINVPAEGFPNGFDLMAVLPHSGLFADTVDQAPTTEGLLDGELCTFTRNGPELSLRFYQEYTDKDNNQPGLKPGARSLKIKFTARRAPDWPEGVERVTTITANAGTAKEKLTLTGEVSVATGAMLNAKWTVTPMESASK